MSKLALQTFTIRKEMRNDLEGSLLRAMTLGLSAFELSRLPFKEKDAEEIFELEKKTGMEVLSLQVKPAILLKRPESISAYAKKVASPAVCVSRMSVKAILGGEKELEDFCEELKRICSLYQDEGLKVLYHHHYWEYGLLPSGETKMQYIFEKVKDLSFILDTYWTAQCGIDPAEQMKKLGDRLYGLHLRDLKMAKSGLKMKPENCELGKGLLDIRKIVAQAEEQKAVYLALEQKCDDPFKSLEISTSYLNANKLLR